MGGGRDMLVFSCAGWLKFYRVLFGTTKKKPLRVHALVVVLMFPSQTEAGVRGAALRLSKARVSACLAECLCLGLAEEVLPDRRDHHRVWPEFWTVTQRAVGSPCRSFTSIPGIKSSPEA